MYLSLQPQQCFTVRTSNIPILESFNFSFFHFGPGIQYINLSKHLSRNSLLRSLPMQWNWIITAKGWQANISRYLNSHASEQSIVLRCFFMPDKNVLVELKYVSSPLMYLYNFRVCFYSRGGFLGVLALLYHINCKFLLIWYVHDWLCLVQGFYLPSLEGRYRNIESLHSLSKKL